jgi:hypothetical protein
VAVAPEHESRLENSAGFATFKFGATADRGRGANGTFALGLAYRLNSLGGACMFWKTAAQKEKERRSALKTEAVETMCTVFDLYCQTVLSRLPWPNRLNFRDQFILGVLIGIARYHSQLSLNWTLSDDDYGYTAARFVRAVTGEDGTFLIRTMHLFEEKALAYDRYARGALSALVYEDFRLGQAKVPASAEILKSARTEAVAACEESPSFEVEDYYRFEVEQRLFENRLIDAENFPQILEPILTSHFNRDSSV